MQRWTTRKPDKPGYWWAFNGKDASVKRVLLAEYFDEELLCCEHCNEYVPLLRSNFLKFLWGSEKIPEPLGEKI